MTDEQDDLHAAHVEQIYVAFHDFCHDHSNLTIELAADQFVTTLDRQDLLEFVTTLHHQDLLAITREGLLRRDANFRIIELKNDDYLENETSIFRRLMSWLGWKTKEPKE